MKKLCTLLLLCAVLLLACAVPALAATDEYTTDVNDTVGTVNWTDTAGNVAAHYTATLNSSTDNAFYLLLVTKGKGDQFSLNVGDITYIDQKTGNGSALSFDFIPKSTPDSSVWLISSALNNTKLKLGGLIARGKTFIGTVTSWNSTKDMVCRLYAADTADATIRAEWRTTAAATTYITDYTAEFANAVTNASNSSKYDSSFTFGAIPEGDYKIAICKEGKYAPLIISVASGSELGLGNLNLYLYGDVNGDSYPNSKDATKILTYAAGNATLDDAQFSAGDVNGDGVVNSKDSTQVLVYAAGNTSASYTVMR